MTAALQCPQGWRVARFGDVVTCLNRTTRHPLADGLERVVGLDDMDSEGLPLERWHLLSDLSDGTSFTRTFREGQVLFGKRRAYQRKVSVPTFDGVCSGDILVFEASGTELLQTFLPYLVQSDGFFDHALGTSAGSLSPRTKWQDLAKYEFTLPPLHQQRRIVEVLQCANAAVKALRTVALQAELTLNLFAEAMVRWDEAFRCDLNYGAVETKTLSDIAVLRRGRFSYRPRNEPRLYAPSGDHPFVQTGDIEKSTGRLDAFSQYLSDEGTRYSRAVEEGTLLITIAAVIGAVSRTTCRTYLPDSIVSVEPVKGESSTEFLELALRGLRKHLENSVATENTQKNLSIEKLAAVRLPVPTLDIQQALVRRGKVLQSLLLGAQLHSSRALSLLTSLREALLKGA